MKAFHIASIAPGQDGAILNGYLFRFGTNGVGSVFDLRETSSDSSAPAILAPIAKIALDQTDRILPHCNSVCFGTEFYREGDEFPLLYCNVYNTYAKREDPMEGVCCVYRVMREGEAFSTALVQLIRIGFAKKEGLWRSSDGGADSRPYGNFVVDRKNGLYHAFVMLDSDGLTRYFSFRLPRCRDGVLDPTSGIYTLTLTEEDILDRFDAPYHNFIQGAACHEGKIYSVEGFGKKIHPALRILDPSAKKQDYFCDFYSMQLPVEAELIDFDGDRCLYADARGNLFRLEF